MEILHNMVFKKKKKRKKTTKLWVISGLSGCANDHQANCSTPLGSKRSSPVKNLRPFFINLTVLSQGTCPREIR